MSKPPFFRSQAAALSALLLFAASCGGPEPVDPFGAGFAETAVEITFAGDYPESPPPGFVPRATFLELREKLELVAKTPRAKGLLLQLGPMGGSFGQLRDVQALVRAVRDAGKPVHCHFDALDNGGYLFAAEACERLSMSPAAHLDLVGFASQVVFAAELLEAIGVNPQIIAIGKYKNAGDVLTERSMPESTAEVLGAILDHLTEELVRAVEARAKGARGRDLIDGGPYLSSAAEAASLVDAVEYADDARAKLKAAAETEKLVKVKIGPELEQPSFGDLLRAFGDEPEQPERGPYIAVVTMSGTILDGSAPEDGNIVSGPFVDHLRKLREDEDAKAVVLRIDSPGGSALASDLIHHEVRSLAEKKPVLASVSTMAASGGYYIAAGAEEIFAHESSLVGSIGVIGGKLDLSPLAARIGVHPETVERGRNATYLSPLSPFDEHERETVRRLLEATYDRFVDAVAEGRDMKREEVLAAAEGRVFTGKAAKELGLVDELAGFEDALSRARKRAKVEATVPLRHFPERKDLFQSLADTLSPASSAFGRAALLETFPALSEPALGWLRLARSSRGPYAMLPYALDVR